MEQLMNSIRTLVRSSYTPFVGVDMDRVIATAQRYLEVSVGDLEVAVQRLQKGE